MEKFIAASQFKIQCRQLLVDVQDKHLTYVITKHGVAIAKLIPVEVSMTQLFGALKESITIKKDIITPTDEDWDVLA